MRRSLRALSTVLIAAGVLLLADGAATLLWEEPLSSLYARIRQAELDDRLTELERGEPSPVERRVLARLPDPAPAHALRGPRCGAAGARRGSRGAAARGRDRARRGGRAGHRRRRAARWPGALPAARRCRARAARSRSPGIGPRTARRSATWTSSSRAIGSSSRCPTAASPIASSGRASSRRRLPGSTRRMAYDRLVLTACHPLYSAAERIVVFARLERSDPSFGS